MKKTARVWGPLALVVFVSGCPDGPEQILRDEKNVAAEVADYLSKVTDEDSAANAVSVADRLKERWDAIKKRREAYLKMADKSEALVFFFLQDPDGLRKKLNPTKPLEGGSLDYKKEMEASMARLQSEGRRVAGIPIADAKVAGEIRGFESKVFGGQLKIPEDPIQIDINQQKKLEAAIFKALRANTDSESTSAYKIGQIAGYVTLGLLGAGVIFWLLTKK
jgi:hypothetical protein